MLLFLIFLSKASYLFMLFYVAAIYFGKFSNKSGSKFKVLIVAEFVIFFAGRHWIQPQFRSELMHFIDKSEETFETLVSFAGICITICQPLWGCGRHIY